MGRRVAEVGEAEPRQRVVHGVATCCRDSPLRRRLNADVLGHRGHHDLRVGIGEDEADPPAHRGTLPRGVEPVHAHPAAGGHHQAVDHPGERRLARPVGADDSDPRLSQHEVDVARTVRSPKRCETSANRISLTRPAPHQHGDALATADGACRHAQARPLGAHHPREQPDDEQRTRRPPGMPERDRAALGADDLGVRAERVEAEPVGAGEELSREGLRDLDRPQLGGGEPRPGADGLDRRGRPEAGQRRVDAHRCGGRGRRARHPRRRAPRLVDHRHEPRRRR